MKNSRHAPDYWNLSAEYYLPLYTVSLMMPRRISNDAKSFPSLPAEPCQAGLFCNSFGKETCKQHELMSQACLGESLINQNLVS